ncbi:MAG: DUF86 domain-containing protein [Nitrospinae bacterium]|nr:DUF86 domain-containing protein [Nitrospinota bacterium]
MRSDKLYLVDILEAVESLDRFLAGKNFEGFYGDEVLKSATLQKLTVIGEAASRISKELKEKYPDVGWPHIAAFRNIAVHAYFAVNWRIVWETATRNTHELKEKIAAILKENISE